MSGVEHLTELHGLPVHEFGPEDRKEPLPAAGDVAWRLSVDAYEEEEEFLERYDRFVAAIDPAGVRGLVIGQWGESYEGDSSEIVERLVADAGRFPALRALFVGDLEQEEAEISWIEQSDLTPLLKAYPALEEFGVRGGTGLVLEQFRHEMLRTLTFEAGGLPAAVVRALGASELPALKYLELWLGVSEYGGDATAADLAPLLAGGRFPALRHLGLRNSEIQDEVASAVAAAPVVAQLNSLDLSLGVLTDTGAEALLGGQPLTHLQWLDLHHHFLSDAMTARVREALEPHGVEVDVSEQETPDNWDGREWRYTAVSE
ncbi:hypothetical protein SRB5_06100 [Streptomyces sp. RB5]|uniref:Leucine-rich repeat domain-containing protein n=1 Tax=Streptomyces smaragdinus TaxID=2585196 RepID=A0A7K0CBK6_9ACTN|nr:STM4015 family protein [Streptomyces smaragdinus]MQY10502.1 hypothetical protein [Streptomyces smaragdinus]